MERRKFIQNSMLAATGISVAGNLPAYGSEKGTKKLSLQAAIQKNLDDRASSSGSIGLLRGKVSEVAPGIWRIRFGEPEQFVPSAFREREPLIESLSKLAEPGLLPFSLDDVRCRQLSGRLVLYVPCDEPNDSIYGFGLDPGAYNQKGLRKFLTVSATVLTKTGASHGPVPFYASTKGYGVWVDTARVPFVHVALLNPKASVIEPTSNTDSALKTSESELYKAQKSKGPKEVVFDIPAARGIDVYIFGGPSLREAVQRYNLFSGGGCIPPMWGLGLKYRTYTRGDSKTVMNVAQTLRNQHVPCDVIGLEPGWQTKAYSSSLVWSDQRFPNHKNYVNQLQNMGYHINLWEHAYIHPSSPLFDPLKEKSADFLVWGGLVVDFPDPQASDLFTRYHDTQFIQQGITGFKLDECDRQPISDASPFNYPYCSTFPSGIDGDQMTQLYGTLYQQSLYKGFKEHNMRTWGDVRATASLAAPLPFNLYSDAYEESEYLLQLLNASYTGLLWSPEVRHAPNLEEFLSRLGIAIFAPQVCLNIWSVPNPIWMQFDAEKNRKNILLPEVEQQEVIEKVRKLMNLRMSLLPYFYSSFYAYRYQGLPPCRALPIEFPNDVKVREIEDAYLFGDAILVAPVLGSANTREVYMPEENNWIDFYTNIRYPGGAVYQINVPSGQVPIFVKENTILPVAKPVEFVTGETIFEVTARIYGDKPSPCTLYEDDGVSFDYEKGIVNKVILSWNNGKGNIKREGEFKGKRYKIVNWDKIAVSDNHPEALPPTPKKL
ncbi:MAG: TIM-barrel domain-containing protein [Bacteroidota bacterium]